MSHDIEAIKEIGDAILYALEEIHKERNLKLSDMLKALVYVLGVFCLIIDMPPENYKEMLQSMINDYVCNYKVNIDGMD